MSMMPLDATLLANIWFGPQASTVAHRVDALYNFLVWISAFFFAVIVIGTIWLAWKYRHREGHTAQPSPSHNTKIEVVWSVIPGILCAAIFWYGFEVYMDLKTVPANAYTIDGQAWKWGWTFSYENGAKSSELHTWAGQPTRLNLSSRDVLHSMWIPDFRVKQDCVPGRFTELWFEAPSPGEHPISCTEYCGTNHSNMKTKVVVHPTREAFQEWMRVAADLFIDPADKNKRRTPEQVGELLYAQNCKTCHSVVAGGSETAAPSFLNLKFGFPRKFVDGTQATIDENYIRNSILYPASQLHEKYPGGGMPSFMGQLSDDYILALIAYLRTLNR